MSDVVTVAIITATSTSVVGLAGLGLNVWSQWQERQQRHIERQEDREEWYRHTLFERRLDALAAEYSWLMKLNRVRADLDDSDEESIDALNQAARQAREWYNQNAIYLHDSPPHSSDFIGAVNASTAHNGDFVRQLNDALKSHRHRAERLMSFEDNRA